MTVLSIGFSSPAVGFVEVGHTGNTVGPQYPLYRLHLDLSKF